MKEIKIRAWDKKRKCFKDVFSIRNDGVFFGNGDFRDIEITQFTGLHDKNGKEIYEGDIIRYHFRTKETNDEFVSRVFFDEYMWLTDEHSINRINEVEIIGNIYENPELLQ